MDEYKLRQIKILKEKNKSYRDGQISLDSLVNDLEFITKALGLDDVEELSDLLIEIEVINSILIEEKRKPDNNEKKDILNCLSKIESIIQS